MEDLAALEWEHTKPKDGLPWYLLPRSMRYKLERRLRDERIGETS